MVKEVFNRFEYKYILTEEQYKKINSYLKDFMVIDDYCKSNKTYQINNFYVDTCDNNLIRTSLAKPKYKHKIRIRSYQDLTDKNELVFIEIKKKMNGLVNKRRSQIKLSEALEMVKTGEIPKIKDYMNFQVLKELQYLLAQDQYSVKTEITYDRVAYFNQFDEDLRVTFDFNIKASRSNQNLLENGNCLMEIKAHNSMPMWLVQYLTQKRIRSTSFSKYGLDYKNIIRKKGVSCQYL